MARGVFGAAASSRAAAAAADSSEIEHGKRQPAGDQLEEHDAEAEEIRSFVDDGARHLFRRHVARGAGNHDARSGDGFDRTRRHGAGGDCRLRDAEIEDLDRAVHHHLDVCRLQVAVNHAFRVRRRERGRELPADREGCRERGTFAAQPRCQAFTFNVLHDDEHALGGVQDVMNRRDMRVADLRGQPGFAERCARAHPRDRAVRRAAASGRLCA